MQIPPNADPHAAAIETILRRIPDGWTRSLGVDLGWYPLVIATDARLATLDADYVVHQIKEKFGALRYYCAPSGDDPAPELLEAFDAITDEAEHVSATTCERCSRLATVHVARHRIKTLCTPCAEMLGYTPLSR
ncbi:hypothetical protein BA059_05025 [Mycolicibacterium sp. (ex Dasyatis americana)]|uniref:hypothetical protein n=1 Tax=Mycobacterium sp. DBP42 TaxID=2545267 RepID=UPI000871DE64|nr:hypothetical protein [Mycobacterium sp. DBP42]OFB42573.1 hypothetical protein BA059_05025 [Mycolicibacterium sp. (ex Dasyatis americana)]TMS50385.1 hypothetical protein E0T84_24045 [Mycobacterium sp. DBP42]